MHLNTKFRFIKKLVKTKKNHNIYLKYRYKGMLFKWISVIQPTCFVIIYYIIRETPVILCLKYSEISNH